MVESQVKLNKQPFPGRLDALALLLAWLGVVALLSSPLGSMENMQRALSWLHRPLTALLALNPSADTVETTLSIFRKGLYLIKYGVLAALAFRWFIGLRGFRLEGALAAALLLSTIIAAFNNGQQYFFASHPSSIMDLGLVVLGSSIVLASIPVWQAEERDFGRRVLDVIGATTGLLLAAPFMAASALAIYLNMGRPILFYQQRLGRGERCFEIIKFRTMRTELVSNGRLLTPSERLTPTGRILRQFSLDELPQLWNVLLGDMSLVGPRPLYEEYLPHYTARERTRHQVRPGITGLAQVKGRNRARWDDRLELDALYVERRSLALDLYLLGKTLGKILDRSDVMDNAIEGSLSQHRKRQEAALP